MDIEDIFFECELSLFDLKVLDIVAIGSIGIEGPDIVDSETCNHRYS